MRVRRINLNMLKIGNEFLGNEEPFRTFLYLSHDHLPLLQCDDQYVIL